MTRFERITGALAVTLLIAGAAASVYYLNTTVEDPMILAVSSCVAAFLALAGYFGVFMNYEIAFKGAFIGFIMLIVALSGYAFASRSGWLSLFENKAAMQDFIARYDGYAIAVFVAVQFLQVTILPIPSTITTLAGIALFGVWKTVLYSSIGIIAGSMFAFFLGRVFGVKLIIWICGAKMFEKYRRFAEGKDVLLLYAMFFLPFFPDDLLCLIAGLGTMSARSFFVMMLITRPVGALWVAGVFKSAVSIPFSGWGLAVWAAIALVTAAVFVLLYKYGNNITRALTAFSAKASAFIKQKIRRKEKSGNICEKSTDRSPGKMHRKSLAYLKRSKSSDPETEKFCKKNSGLTDYRN